MLNVEPEESLVVPQSPRAGQSPLVVRTQPTTRPLDQAALNGLAMAVLNTPSHNDKDPNWVNLADVGSHLSRISPNLHARNYGYDRLRDFAAASGIIEWKWKEMGEKPPIVLVRLK